MKAIKRRLVEPFTCFDFPQEESGQNDPLKLVSERALLTPMNTNQVKTELELVQMQNQIGNILRHIPLIEMEGILEEVFTIDVDDIDGHTYDERFAELFGLNQLMTDEVKQEPQEEPVGENEQQIEVAPHQLCEADPVGVASTSAAAIAKTTMPSNNATPLPGNSPKAIPIDKPIPSATVMATENNMHSSNNMIHDHEREWLIDLTSEDCVMGGAVYDEHFARYFGLMENELPNNEIKEEVVDAAFDAIDETNQFAQLPDNSSDEEQELPPPSPAIATAMEYRAKPSNNMAQQPVQDPISHQYQFEVDVCN